MRILAIGLGGAGGRIVNHLYRTDRRSSKVVCVQALTVDVDKDAIARLTDLPDNAKIYFPPLDISSPESTGTEQTATIDVAEVCSRAQSMATGETDAIIFCMGLGGTMADTAPHIIASLRSSVTEPIFALITLPCLSEGERCSAKAADQIETISPMLDGVIVFDNETWHKKVKVTEKMEPHTDQGFAAKIGLKKKKKEPVLSPAEKTYFLLNDAIIRRLSLILRAGEFKADGGLELAEVVLDSGEVLNTMRGMGFITIGYAVEQLPSHPLDFLARLRPAGFFADEHMKKASRVVDLAKQAIYHEISAPCDITSAHKALILIAGPSHELSMKGFMTVRKWIDRSIAGLETRSGDYPVTSTKFVAIIIMLSGLENIPRITELMEIRAQVRIRSAEPALPSGDTEVPVMEEGSGQPAGIRDEMITLDAGRKTRGHRYPPLRANEGIPKTEAVVPATHHPPPNRTVAIPDPRKIERQLEAPSSPAKGEPVHAVRKVLATRSPIPREERDSESPDKRGTSREQERRRIEQELQRQRRLAIGGIREHEHPSRKESTDHEPEGIRHSGTGEGRPRESAPEPARTEKQVIVTKQAAKRVVIHKRSERREDRSSRQEPRSAEQPPARSPLAAQEDKELLDLWIRQVSDRKKEALSDEGGAVRIDENPAATRDTALLHTDLKRERPGKKDPDAIGIRVAEPPPREIHPASKKRSRTDDKEDLSWVE